MRLPTLLALLALTAATTTSLFPLRAESPTLPPTTTSRPLATAPKKQQLAVLSLSGTLRERPADFSLSDFTSDSGHAPALSELLPLFHKAAADPTLAGILLNLKQAQLSLAQAQELGVLIQKVRAAGKKVYVYASDFDTSTYVLATYADKIIMPEQGNLLIPGVQMNLMFFGGLLEKIHVQADMVQIGKFKGAAEPMTRTEASPEFKQQIDDLADGLFFDLFTTIATNRPAIGDKDQVLKVIDEAWINGKRAKELGLVDELLTPTERDAYILKQLPPKTTLETAYGQPKRPTIDMNNPFAIFSLLNQADSKPTSTQPGIAIIYADGTITGDTTSELNSNDNVTPSGMRKSFQKALEDSRVKSIVLRIDSPGGSASASDEIWQIVKQADAQKPVTVSMGRIAASGGYYIACAGRSISADPSTITGSIGVVGGKIVIKGLLDVVGLNIQPISRGKHAAMLNSLTAFTPEERTFVTQLMTETYTLFTERVKTGRGDKIKEVAEVAQGRLFTGSAARKVGLVDEVQTLSDTVTAAAKAANIDKNYQILVYPETRTLSDIIRLGLSGEAHLPLELSSTLRLVPAAYRQQTLNFLGMLQIMQQEKVMLACPLNFVEGN